MKRWLKLTMELDPVLVDSVTDFLVGAVGAGVEMAEEGRDDLQVLHVYLEGENPSDEELHGRLASIKEHTDNLSDIFRTKAPAIHWETYEEEDWGRNWKKYFTPFAIIPGLVIVPTWERYEPKQNENVLVMDPGMAFGTGHHATTTLAMEFIRECLDTEIRSKRILDVGTGTGILGMAAVLFGAEEVLGIDNDPVAVAAAAENINVNSLDSLMQASETPLGDIAGQYGLVIANIVHDVLVELAEDLARVTENGGLLVLSGILADGQTDSIRDVFQAKGFTFREQRIRGEWAAILFEKTAVDYSSDSPSMGVS